MTTTTTTTAATATAAESDSLRPADLSVAVEASNIGTDAAADMQTAEQTPPSPVSDDRSDVIEDIITNAISNAAIEDMEDQHMKEYEEKTAELEDMAVLDEDDTHENSKRKGLKVLFLSSDTGGGHRASAESLARQFELLFPGSTYELLDIASEAYLPPYNSIVSYYKHLSAHPSQWNMIYKVTNSRTMERLIDTNIKVMTMYCERSMRRKLNSYQADVVISVHPLMTHVPVQACAKLSHESGKHLPMFTVVTDLGSAHSTWFANGVERMFVGSQQIYDLAKDRGKVPDEKLVMAGLPIRHDFAVQAENLGDRMSPEGQTYQRTVRQKLKLPAVDRKTLLVMGGGEGVGSLSNIVNALYVELARQGIDAVILVVCGRNEILKSTLEHRDWSQLMEASKGRHRSAHNGRMSSSRSVPKLSSMFSLPKSYASPISACTDSPTALSGCIEGGMVTNSLRRILSTGSMRTNRSAVIVPTSPNMDYGEEKKNDDDSDDDSNVRHRHAECSAMTVMPENDEVEPNKPLSQVKKANSFTAIDYTSEIDNGNNKDASANVANTEESILQIDTSDQSEYEIGVDEENVESPGTVDVVGLGFITNMAEYMVAADVLISKAGPGTISEAAALSLPVMLTSFLPGQEEGNVDYVVDGGFGAFCHDSDPGVVAEEVAFWLTNPRKMAEMSAAAKAKGSPYAARNIVKQIGESALAWKAINESVRKE